MAKVTMILTGDERLNAKLELLKGAQAKSVIAQASCEALRPTQSAVQRNAPKRTGRLANSFRIRPMRTRSRVGAVLRSSANNATRNRFYGAAQELGWKTRAGRSVSSLISRRQIRGQGFIRKSAEATRSAAMDVFKREAALGIERLVGAS